MPRPKYVTHVPSGSVFIAGIVSPISLNVSSVNTINNMITIVGTHNPMIALL